MAIALAGSYTGDNTTNRAITTAMNGTPAVVWVTRDIAGILTTTWAQSSFAANFRKQWNADIFTDTPNVLTLTTTGFQVHKNGGSALTNNLGETYYWCAIEEDGIEVETGTYTGDGTASQVITTSFQPDYIHVTAAANRLVYGWFASKGGDNTYILNIAIASDSGPVTNHVTAVGATSFTVGLSLNTNTVVYHWHAIKSGTDHKQNKYTGDGTTLQEVDTEILGEGLFLIRDDGGPTDDEMVYANGGMAGISSFDQTGRITDGILDVDNVNALTGGVGFSIGVNNKVNVNAVDYHFIHLGVIPPVEDFSGSAPPFSFIDYGAFTTPLHSPYTLYKDMLNLGERLQKARIL